MYNFLKLSSALDSFSKIKKKKKKEKSILSFYMSEGLDSEPLITSA